MKRLYELLQTGEYLDDHGTRKQIRGDISKLHKVIGLLGSCVPAGNEKRLSSWGQGHGMPMGTPTGMPKGMPNCHVYGHLNGPAYGHAHDHAGPGVPEIPLEGHPSGKSRASERRHQVLGHPYSCFGAGDLGLHVK